MRATDVLFGAAVAAILGGRLAVGHDDEPGALFYAVGPAAFALGVVLLFAAIRLAEPLRGVLYPLGGALLGGALAASPGADDGPIAIGFLVGGACLAVVALLQARELRRRETQPRTRAASTAAMGVAGLLVLAALVVVAGIVLLLILLPADA